MYDELVKRLRAVAGGGREEKCDGCPYEEDYPCCVDCLDKLHKQAADAIEELSKPKWVSVEEDGLPFEPNEYLVYVRDGITDKKTNIPDLDIDLSYVTTAYFDPDTCLWNENQEYYNGNLECVNRNKVYYISHWADKPKPPKEKNNVQG